jgi:hypothetical protein
MDDWSPKVQLANAIADEIDREGDFFQKYRHAHAHLSDHDYRNVELYAAVNRRDYFMGLLYVDPTLQEKEKVEHFEFLQWVARTCVDSEESARAYRAWQAYAKIQQRRSLDELELMEKATLDAEIIKTSEVLREMYAGISGLRENFHQDMWQAKKIIELGFTDKFMNDVLASDFVETGFTAMNIDPNGWDQVRQDINADLAPHVPEHISNKGMEHVLKIAPLERYHYQWVNFWLHVKEKQFEPLAYRGLTDLAATQAFDDPSVVNRLYNATKKEFNHLVNHVFQKQAVQLTENWGLAIARTIEKQYTTEVEELIQPYVYSAIESIWQLKPLWTDLASQSACSLRLKKLLKRFNSKEGVIQIPNRDGNKIRHAVKIDPSKVR